MESRSEALEGRIAAELALGRHGEVIGELRALAREQPLHEAFHGQLMLALYRADRPAEALDVYVGLQRALADRLGVEPSPAIRELHRRIMKADPGLALGAGDDTA
jgi:DNA-binding SARP family transcriptional activator